MTITTPVHATREDVKGALDYKETARNNAAVDRALESASRGVERLLRRRFYPEIGTRYFDWPNYQRARPWRLWLGEYEFASVSALVSGGTTIAATDYFLEPVNSGPPYTSIEIDLDSTASFKAGGTHQRSISVTGTLCGAPLDTSPAGVLAGAIASTSATTFAVTDSSLIGVGSLIKIDSERMLVTGKASLTTGQTIQTSALTASMANETLLVTTGSSFAVGEVLTVDSERVLVVDITSNTLTVKRAYDGSTLATHGTGVTIYAPRTLTVVRGMLGTTAATHLDAAPITTHVYPAPVRELTIAETGALLRGQGRAWARSTGSQESEVSPDGAGLPALRESVRRAYGRRIFGMAI